MMNTYVHANIPHVMILTNKLSSELPCGDLPESSLGSQQVLDQEGLNPKVPSLAVAVGARDIKERTVFRLPQFGSELYEGFQDHRPLRVCWHARLSLNHKGATWKKKDRLKMLKI